MQKIFDRDWRLRGAQSPNHSYPSGSQLSSHTTLVAPQDVALRPSTAGYEACDLAPLPVHPDLVLDQVSRLQLAKLTEYVVLILIFRPRDVVQYVGLECESYDKGRQNGAENYDHLVEFRFVGCEAGIPLAPLLEQSGHPQLDFLECAEVSALPEDVSAKFSIRVQVSVQLSFFNYAQPHLARPVQRM